MARAAIYARLSKRNEVNAPNLDDQIARCRELAVSRGWTVVDTHVDYGESAYNRANIEDRPAFADLLAGIRAKSYDAIIAWRPDRLWRDPLEAAIVLRDCSKAGVQTVATVAEGDRDPTNPGDEMVTTMVAAVGRYESAAKSARLRAKKRQHAEQGRPSGGMAPLGFTDTDRAEVDVDVAARLNRATEDVIAGRSIRSIAVEWNRDGFRTVTGRPWSPANVRRQLAQPYLAGLRVHRDEIVGPGTWPAIIPPDRWSLMQDTLSDPGRRTTTSGREYLLTRGLAVCGLCDAALISRPRADGARCYVCATGAGLHGCGKIRALAESLEADVTARFWAGIDEGLVADAEPEPVAPVSLSEFEAAERRLADLARDHYVLAVIGRDEYLAARAPLAAEVERMRSMLAPPTNRRALTVDDLRFGWANLSPRERGDALAVFVEAVVVGAAVRGRNTYDPDRITVRWRV